MTIQLPFKVKTIVSWPGEEDGDLGFIENEIVEVYSIVDDAWYSGKLRRNNAEGIFPKDYVEIINDKSTSFSDLSLNNISRQTTPKAATPVKYSRTTSYEDFNTTYDQIEVNNRKKMYNHPKKVRSANQLSSSKNHPKLGHLYQQQEELLREKERELEKYKNYERKLIAERNEKQDYNKHISDYRPKDGYETDSYKLPARQSYSKYEYNSPERQDSRQLDPRQYERQLDPRHRLFDTQSHPRQGSFNLPGRQSGPRQGSFDLPGRQSGPRHGSFDLQGKQSGPRHGSFDLPIGQKDLRENLYTSESPLDPRNDSHRNSKNLVPQEYSNRSHLDSRQLLPDVRQANSKDFDSRRQLLIDMKNYSNKQSPDSRQLHHSSSRQQIPHSSSRQLIPLPSKNYQQLGSSDALKSHSFVDVNDESCEDVPSDDDIEYEEILRKKAELEIALNKLKSLERLKLKQSVKNSSRDSSYISEDLLSLKKHYSSRDDLGRKLNNGDDFDTQTDSTTPPPPPKHNKPRKTIEDFAKSGRIPFDANDFQLSSASLTEEEKRYQEDLKNSIKSLQSDVLNLSELSATSAGSMLRHKYDREYQAQQSVSRTRTEDDRKELIDAVFQDRKSKQQNIFMKLINKKKDEPIDKKEEQDWSTWKQDLFRMNSLTSSDKQKRTKRVVREENNIILKPLECISEINTNELIGDEIEIDITKISFDKADAFMGNYNLQTNLNDLISDVSIKFQKSIIYQVRCILIHLSKFKILEEESGTIQQIKPKLGEIISKGEASIFQINYIFKKILDSLRIPSEIVLGFWKKPNEFYHDEQFVINHCWLSILIEDNLLIMDIKSFKDAKLCNLTKEKYNEFYFLTKPLQVVSTHIPSVIDLQHIRPPIDPNVALYLPREYSGFHKYGLKIRNFNAALTRLKDLEIFELEVEVGIDVELFTLIKTSNVTSNELSLCQVKWVKNQRIYKIKAILPDEDSIGVVQVFAGPKGTQKHFDNVHELSIVIPIYHQGEFKTSKFVSRFPTIQSQKNDIYIKQPQGSVIKSKNFYNFIIEQHPSDEDEEETDFKVVIESPSGKYYKLEKGDHTKLYGVYECNVKCQEIGVYRGLVIGDSGSSWYVFAQWNCI